MRTTLAKPTYPIIIGCRDKHLKSFSASKYSYHVPPLTQSSHNHSTNAPDIVRFPIEASSSSTASTASSNYCQTSLPPNVPISSSQLSPGFQSIGDHRLMPTEYDSMICTIVLGTLVEGISVCWKVFQMLGESGVNRRVLVATLAMWGLIDRKQG